MTYLITFACYGCHLHGEERGSIDREHNLFGARTLPANPTRLLAMHRRMKQSPYELDLRRREIVLSALIDRCRDRQSTLEAAHVRTNHVHIVVDAEPPPEKVMNDLKSFASRRLNEAALDELGRIRWARHGSTRWLWKQEDVVAAIRYVVGCQGEPMAVFNRNTDSVALPMVAAQ